MTLGGAAQVAAAHCPNERTLDPAVCSYNRPTYAPASRTMAFTRNVSTVFIACFLYLKFIQLFGYPATSVQ